MPALFVTDMTALAQNFPRHSGATTLWLDFDGYASQGVSAFQSITGDLNKDIHDVLFRTQEIFSPFDVIVRRRFGDGNVDTSSSGNTTVFIGDNTAYGTGSGMMGLDSHSDHDGLVEDDDHDHDHESDDPDSHSDDCTCGSAVGGAGNGAGAFTPWASSDFPSSNKGSTHVPNSDAYDVAYVDPLYYSGGSNVSRNAAWISRAIAHEAGHSFGLVHVLSSPDQEIMSYDATNVRFINKTFNITSLNYNPSTGSNYNEPKLQPTWLTNIDLGWIQIPYLNTITTQDSFTYLNAVLGARSTSGDFANVADSTTIDSSFADGSMWIMSVGSSVTASINRSGDFDVYSFTPSSSQWVNINVKRTGTSTVDSVLLAYNSNGQSVLGFDDDSGGSLQSKLTMYVTAGTNYKLSVGSYAGTSTGGYELSISSTSLLATTSLSTLAATSLTSSSFSSVATFAGAGAGMAGPGRAGSDSGFGLYQFAADSSIAPAFKSSNGGNDLAGPSKPATDEVFALQHKAVEEPAAQAPNSNLGAPEAGSSDNADLARLLAKTQRIESSIGVLDQLFAQAGVL